MNVNKVGRGAKPNKHSKLSKVIVFRRNFLFVICSAKSSICKAKLLFFAYGVPFKQKSSMDRKKIVLDRADWLEIQAVFWSFVVFTDYWGYFSNFGGQLAWVQNLTRRAHDPWTNQNSVRQYDVIFLQFNWMRTQKFKMAEHIEFYF